MKNEEFMNTISEAEAMFYSACENADEEAVDEIAHEITDFFSEKFSEFRNADVLLAICGFLASYCEFMAGEANTDNRTALMVLQVGMQRALFATAEMLEVADRGKDKNLH